jgi:hypothetical protein
MANYTYTVIFMDSEIAFGEGESFEYAREEALGQVFNPSGIASMYPRDDLEFISTCDSGVIGSVSGPCFL